MFKSIFITCQLSVRSCDCHECEKITFLEDCLIYYWTHNCKSSHVKCWYKHQNICFLEYLAFKNTTSIWIFLRKKPFNILYFWSENPQKWNTAYPQLFKILWYKCYMIHNKKSCLSALCSRSCANSSNLLENFASHMSQWWGRPPIWTFSWT